MGVGGARVGSAPEKHPIRKRFEALLDKTIDDGMKKGESWAKKVGNGNQGVMLDDIPRLIDVLGFKLVDKRKVCVDPEEHEAYKALAKAHMNGPKLEQDFDA